MTELLQVYKCDICGIVIEVLHAGGGQLVCCGQSMNLLEEKASDIGMEKHVPVFEIAGSELHVRVGSVPHPMEENHYIEWIELVSGENSVRKFLKPGKKPEAGFMAQRAGFVVRAYCNIHGLWKSG